MKMRTVGSLAILDFDIEARATGYGDPRWVPQEITAIAWSWIGDERVVCHLRCNGAPRMLARFRAVYEKANIVTGHNIRKYDLPLVNAEMLRFGMTPLPATLTQDTLRQITRTTGMKRDQDNLGKLLNTETDKHAMSWQDWQDAYAESGWGGVRKRVVTDVVGHKQIRARMIEDGWIKPPVIWRP